uniref:Jac1 n=1 Tax=Stygiella incarcerata TaxID=1712417 RepID=A0A192ZIX7_9EUKA|nr:Jac1 [Stygiella incarcerata]
MSLSRFVQSHELLISLISNLPNLPIVLSPPFTFLINPTCSFVSSSARSQKAHLMFKHQTLSLIPTHGNNLFQRQALGVRHLILSTRQSGPRKCWSCGSLLLPNEMFCGECSRIQPLPANADFFSILGMPRKLVIDSEEAHRNLQDLQMVLHPDKFAVKSKKEQDISRSVSTFLNQAYQTISDPFSRMFYILSLEGMDRETLGNVVDQDFLEEMMEKMELANDLEVNSEEFLKLQDENYDAMEAQFMRAADAMEKRNSSEAGRAAGVLNYLNRINVTLRDRQTELEIHVHSDI